MGGHVLMEDSPCSHIHNNEYVNGAKSAVTTTKKSHATIALAWLWTKISHRCCGSAFRLGPPPCKYLSTVLGETRIPSFSFSLAMRSSPQVAFSNAISRISCRMFLGKRGLPVGLDFQRQNSRNPFWCQWTSVSGVTLISTSRHGKMGLR